MNHIQFVPVPRDRRLLLHCLGLENVYEVLHYTYSQRSHPGLSAHMVRLSRRARHHGRRRSANWLKGRRFDLSLRASDSCVESCTRNACPHHYTLCHLLSLSIPLRRHLERRSPKDGCCFPKRRHPAAFKLVQRRRRQLYADVSAPYRPHSGLRASVLWRSEVITKLHAEAPRRVDREQRNHASKP